MNDWLLKINDIDLTNKDRKQVIKAVLNGGGVINMVVRRRKSLGGRLVTPVHINLIGHKGIVLLYLVFCTRKYLLYKISVIFLFFLITLPMCMISLESGIGLEGGVYVTALAAGSPAAREGSLNIGDRLIAVSLQWLALFDQIK